MSWNNHRKLSGVYGILVKMLKDGQNFDIEKTVNDILKNEMVIV